MWLKNTPNLAERLASEVNLTDLTNFISYARSVENAWLWDYSQDVLAAMEAVRLLTEGAVYAFKVEDGYSERMWWNSEGVYLYRRIWENGSIDIFSWENIGWWYTSIPTSEDAIKFLIINKINYIFTWHIIWEFLGIESHYTDDDGDEIIKSILDDSTIEQMRESWIEVTVLDELL